MKHIHKERDRLLREGARFFGLTATMVGVLCLLVPGALDPQLFLPVFTLLAALALSQYRLGVTGNTAWVVAILMCGLGSVIVLNLLAPMNQSLGNAVAALLSCGLGSVAIVLALDLRRYAFGLFAFLITVATVIITSPPEYIVGLVITTTVGWSTAAVIGWWLSASVPRVMRRITTIGRAHQTERQASETEAQRRQGARLLHDTVLATLTLLAHSGVGVSPDVLRQQAADDARLLRQLRTGDLAAKAPAFAPPTVGAQPVAVPPINTAGGTGAGSTVDAFGRTGVGSTAGTTATLEEVGGGHRLLTHETALGTTLESVKQRFQRIGLEVSWHGTGQVLLPSDILDAFLLALAECLENVRRHSGVTDAHVTITEDEATVRAMVTDAGVGFDVDNIGQAKLGFKESVVARLREVGGNARLFSSPGSGTTVVLEAPK